MMKPVQPSTPASPTPRARSAPFSVHSRGVMLFDQHRFLDGKFIGLGIFRCCLICCYPAAPFLPCKPSSVPVQRHWRAQPDGGLV